MCFFSLHPQGVSPPRAAAKLLVLARRERIEARDIKRILLDLLDDACTAEQLNIPGYYLHPLKGDRKGEWAMTVSGNWRITFRFEDEDAVDVNLEDYH